MRAVISLTVLVASVAFAQAPDSRFSAGGYFRIAARPDFQGGNGKLGYWNLNGRLMNEGTYAALELKLDLLQAPPGSNDIWASLYARVEGGSVTTADSGNGNLINFRVSQLYARVGNVLAPNLIFQLGTLQYFFGDLGLYDMRPAQLFEDTIGLSARYTTPKMDLLLAAGDSGFALRGTQYAPIATVGAAARFRLGDHVELGGGGQVSIEPFVAGNKYSSYVTPGVTYEDFARQEVLRRFQENNPTLTADQFPLPVRSANTSVSWRAVFYFGFGKLGPLKWSNLFARYAHLHPQNYYTDSYNGRSVTVYVADLTRQRYALQVGNEMQLTVIPEWLDAVWSVLYGTDRDYQNAIQASESNREYMSTVLRLQLYMTKHVHWLLENAISQETSINGNLYRTHYDSIFQNSNGTPDTRGLQFGDSAVRRSWQLKTGLVLSPLGRGIYTRPSIRLLYGFQYSSQHAAFGSGFVTALDQYNAFRPTSTVAWHHLVSLEAEGWF